MTAIERICIDIIGTGNVATHLHKAFSAAGKSVDVAMINPRTLKGKRSKTDFTIIAVKDDAIPQIASKICTSDCGVIAHTSGSTPLYILANAFNQPGKYNDCSVTGKNSEKNLSTPGFGVFYPLQTFSKDIELNYPEIPFFIEASDKQTENNLIKLASLISRKVLIADSTQRKAIHLAGVLACNFTNHLIGMSKEILESCKLPLDALQPLVNETIRKAFLTNDPYKAQTGPAVRGDISTMNSHLELLDSFPEMKEIYKTLSNSIIEKHVSN